MKKMLFFLNSLLFIALLVSCQESMIESDNSNHYLNKDGKSPDTDVHGIVYKGGSVRSGATVQLLFGGQVIDSTITDSNGYYIMNVCTHHKRTGTYTVIATYVDKFQGIWQDTDSFYWNDETGPWDFEIDLYLSAV